MARTGVQPIEERSFEAMAQSIERQQASEEDDPERDLRELIRALTDTRAESLTVDDFVRMDEFACRGCHLILHRSQLSRRDRSLCADCTALG